ncbi:unnamed protein product [Sphagnum jensenii]|uniref:Uncharacterized protein n=1 Tax=Sphagnum jensenii TaxID=128206 RepID=A0ABP1AZ15_9BRYO
MGVGVWRGKAKAQEKAQKMQGRWRESQGARASGRLTKAPDEHGEGLTGCGSFRQALSARLCLGFFLIQKLLSFRVLKRTELVDRPRCAMILRLTVPALSRRLHKLQFLAWKTQQLTVPPEAPIPGVEEAAGDSDDIMEYSSGVEEVAPSCVLEWHFSLFDRECFLLHCWKVQDTGSGTSGVYRSPVRSLKELEEAGEECNSIHLISVDFVFPKLFHSDVPELEVTEELIELVMRINKDRVPLSLGRCWGVSIYFFSQCMVFQPAKVYEAGGGDGHR